MSKLPQNSTTDAPQPEKRQPAPPMGQDFIVVDGAQENFPSMFSKDILSAGSLSPTADRLPEYVQRVAYKSNQSMVPASQPNAIKSQPQYTLKADWYVA